MARLNREVVTALIIDASRARLGAEEFDRAAAKLVSANSAAQRAAERTTVILGDQAKALDRLRRQIDPTHAATKKLEDGQEKLKKAFDGGKISLAEHERLLGLLKGKYDGTTIAAKAAAEEQAAAFTRMRAKYDPLFAANERYKAELRDLMAAQQAGAVDEPNFRREHARIERDLNPAAIQARKLAEAEAKLAADQQKAADAAARNAREVDLLRAKYDSAFAITLKYRDALAAAAEAERRGALQGDALFRELNRIVTTLHPAAVESRRLADAQAALAAEQAHAAQVAAQEARALDQLRAKYDPVHAATQRYRDALKDLADAAQQGAIRGKPLADALDRIERELNPVGIASRKTAEAQAALQMRARALTESLNPLERAQRLYSEAIREAQELYWRGAINLRQYEQATQHAAKALHDAREASGGFAAAERERARITARRITQLSPQISDIVSQAMSGTNPFTILVQQGPQIADIWGGIPTLLRAIPPHVYAIGAAFVVVGGAAILAAKRIAEIAEQSRRLESIGRTVNPQVAGMAAHLREMTLAMTEKGVGRADAMKAVEEIARNRVLQAQLYAALANIAPDVMARLGTDAPGAAKALGEALSRGANGVRELNERLNFLEPDQLKQIELMDRQNDRLGAMRMALGLLTAKYEGEAVAILSAWDRMTNAMGVAWDTLWEKIALSPQAQAFMNDWANVADMVTRALGKTEAAAAGATGALGTTTGRVAALVAEANELVKQIDEATRQAEELGQGVSGAPGQGVSVQVGRNDAADAAWIRADELNQQLERKRREIAAAEKAARDAAPGTGGTIPLDDRGLTPDEQMRVEKSIDLYNLETQQMKANRIERQVALAGHQAYTAARQRDAGEAEATQERLLAERRARRDLAVAIGDENQMLDLNSGQTDAVASAYGESVEQGLRAAAMHQALRDELTTGADAAARAIRLLNQAASDAYLASQQSLKKLVRDVANLKGVAEGSRGDVPDEMEARRTAEAEAAFREAIDAATAARDERKVADLVRMRTAYQDVLRERDRNNAAIAVETQLRRPLENQLELVEKEATLVGATVEQREREIALLQLRQALAAQGYRGKELDDEAKRLGKIVERQAQVSEATRKATEAFERNKQAVQDAAQIMTDAFQDLVIEGASFKDVVGNIEKALLHLGTQVLVVEPLMRALREAMNGTASTGTTPGSVGGGGGTESTLMQFGSFAMNLLGMTGGTGIQSNIASGGMSPTTGVTTATYGGYGGAPTMPVTAVPLHTGGIAGLDGQPPRVVPQTVFVSAPRLHSGMRPGEFGAILERGEEVLTARDPRHRRNFRGGGGPVINMHINTPDAASFRASQQQVGATASRALQMALRRNG